MKSKIVIIGIILVGSLLILAGAVCADEQIDWRTLGENLVLDYQGRIISVEQLNWRTCWIILSPDIIYSQAVKIAENIGYYIRNTTGGLKGETPSVHVFINKKHIAVARPQGNKYVGKIQIEDWDPSTFEGEYRP